MEVEHLEVDFSKPAVLDVRELCLPPKAHLEIQGEIFGSHSLRSIATGL